ncbi:DEAD/DEAH box helicase, partial [Vibrio xuii]
MTSLPIDPLKSHFLAQLSENHLIVEADTGSGKSTRLPLWASEHGRVLVVEPRRIACTSLAQFLAEQKQERLGTSIGYAIKLDNQCDDNTQVVFATPGVALRWFSENQLAGFDIIIVDEFHERRWDSDLLLALLNEHKRHQLVITSATIEGEKLATYVGASRLRA